MTTPSTVLVASISGAFPHAHFFWAWILLCLALALHVVDEACTGFLSVYNPTVMALRERRPWFPMPIFTFGVWLAGLVAAVVLVFALSILVWQGARWMRPLGFVFAVILLANSLVHMVGTIRGRTVNSVPFRRPMPGFYSSPFMLLASLYMLWAL